ncbi:RNA polymerase beta prime subunit [Vibrio phage vB_pir03]|nr:RNA polymerase beta prime subunit [Vibrio phage vB_pir03]
MYCSRIWCLRSTALPKDMVEHTERNMPNNDGKRWYFYNDENELVVIEGADPKAPLFGREEKMTLSEGEFPGVKGTINTAYSQALINAILFVWPFEAVLPYVQGRVNGKAVDKIVAELAEKGTITVEEYRRRWHKACGHIKAFTQTQVTAATPRSISPSPEALKKREELLKKYAGKLDDPAVLAEIDQTISAIDREFIKGDESERFFLKGKQIDTVRKKLFHIQGGVPRLDDPTRMDLLANSLDEGMTPDNMPAAVNNLRSGSYGRAKDTALGGEAAKFATRAFQNVRIPSEDCGTQIGEPTIITSDHVDELTGMFLVGEDEPLTEARIKKLIGKNVYVRVPATCKEPQRNYCRRCVGTRIADSGIGIGALMNQTGNVFMSVSLAAFHGSSLKTTRLTREKGFKKIYRVM